MLVEDSHEYNWYYIQFINDYDAEAGPLALGVGI